MGRRVTPYSWDNWEIPPAEYKMLQQAIDQGILLERQVENSRLFFKWGTERGADLIQRLDWKHEFHTDIVPVRDFISQKEFERICLDVIEEYPQVKVRFFEYAVFHFSFPSNSGKSINSGYVSFDDGGRITGRRGCFYGDYGATLPQGIAERVRRKIRSALYAHE